VVKQRMAAGEDLYRLDRQRLRRHRSDARGDNRICVRSAQSTVTKVDDAVAFLGCNAEILTLDPMTPRRKVISSRAALVGDATGTSVAAEAIIA